MFDIIIKNGIIVDGTGEKRYKGNIGIKDGKITFVGSCCENEISEAKEIINAEGLIITPGFIDFHSHSDFVLLVETRATNMLKQGITTEVTGHCGLSLIPLSDEIVRQMKPYIPSEKYNELAVISRRPPDIISKIEKSNLGTNIAFLVGHGTIRAEVMGYEDRKPSDKELEKMKALIREAMEAGAIGMSSGLIYPPGVYAKEEELTELCKIVSEHGGIYTSHMRSESNFVIDSVKETIRIGENAKLPVVISHHKIAGKQNWGKSKETLKLIEEANFKGIKVRLDQYPYKAGATSLMSALPPNYAVDGFSKLLEKLQDKKIRHEIKQLLMSNQVDFENLIYGCGLDGVLIVEAPTTKELCGKTIAQLAKELNKDPYDTIFDLLIENEGNVGAVYFMMDYEDIERIMAYKFTMGGTDAIYINEQLPAGHPRFTGTFTKILSEYIRDKKIVSLEEGIRKLTSMPADIAGFSTKGIIKEGYDADLVILDYENLKANSDFINPSAPNEGVKYVLVNGKIAVKDDTITGICAGKVIR
ncbi:amidohydrolase family protein [Desulfosporosinus sp. BICA1-9]|uniref:N-acyl-D-amino-acid deacylase family protein n=1 Tax=Desulfosporosinus sp. BICA1-9 TaxID=1531958 RepID=UPI00054C6B41|nr:D-aminoacylase [Desulfosporosinus sp. BICA1-9]KJS47487.1 MAG: hypothetical protein VR66_19425 [Peptococcaceae bacterium BRH_c23]KJS84530.1 MAG: hypothetical protein JL57_20570 [Desulfosporosinus sp. BICA1-9]HBW37554.1 D-aminoacylase [Desulfosporosinus sp.]